MTVIKARAAAEIDALIAAFYAAFDNRGGRAPALNDLRAMFSAEATITRVSPPSADTWSPEDFITPREVMLSDGTLTEFHEWEIEASTTVFDNIASRRSIYEKQGLFNGEPYGGGGRKFIQMCRTGDDWRISSILWEDI